MNRDDSMRAYLASHLMNLYPQSIRSELLSDTELMKEIGVATDATIKFGEGGISFSRNALFNAVREAFAAEDSEPKVKDENGDVWVVCSFLGEVPVVILAKGDIKISNDSLWPLSSEIDKRILIFEKEAKKRNISVEDFNKWKTFLSEPIVGEDEVSDLLIDFDCTPHHIEALLKQEFKGVTNNISTLVPTDVRYYERLVGKYHASINIEEYCQNELKYFVNQRVRKCVDINDFLLCIHRVISKELSESFVDVAHYNSIADYAIKTCHPILLIACLEIGILSFIDSSASVVEKLFESVSSPKALESLRLFCSIAVFVDGELARLQLFKGKPPFYRRLASFTQTALIVKVALEEDIAIDKVEQWAMQQRGLYFYCQTFIDLREEPRWLPEYLTAEQFIKEIYGRVSNACQEANTCETIENLQKELRSGSRLSLHSFLPGPLEGNSTPAVIPDDISDLLGQHIKDVASLESFKVLINSAPFWKIDEDNLDRAISLLENAQHQLRADNDKDSIYQVLIGLAEVSCMTRSKKLAASVMILSRIYRDYLKVDSEPENYLAMGIVAAAAFEDKDGWAEYIGRWCTELVYLPISIDAISKLKSMLEQLCILEPYLFYTCSKALGILRMLSSK